MQTAIKIQIAKIKTTTHSQPWHATQAYRPGCLVHSTLCAARTSALLALVGSMLLGGVSNGFAQGVTPDEALERAYDNARSVRFNIGIDIFQKGGAYAKETKFSRIDAEVMHSDGRWIVRGTRATNRLQNGKVKEFAGGFEFLLDDKQRINVEWHGKDSMDNAPLISATYDTTRLKREHGTTALSDAEVVFGLVPLRVPMTLAELVRANKDRLSVDSKASGQTLEFTDQHGRWMIEMNGTPPMPIAIHNFKGPDDLAGSERVANWKGGGIYPPGNATAYEVHIDPIEWSNDLGSPFIRSYTFRSVTTFGSSGKFEKRTEVEISKPNIPSGSDLADFRIARRIGNGTPVYVRETPAIAHEWWDGKIRKKVDIDALEHLSDVRFTQPQTGYITLNRAVFVLCLATLIGSLAFLIYRRVKMP